MSILDMSVPDLVAAKKFRIEDLPAGPDHRVAIYRQPVPLHTYVVGADFAHGMAGGDFDAAQVFDRDVTPWEQVAVLHGRWGETRFHKLLYAILRYYNDAFLIGERQVGLAVMRTLADEYGWTYMYYERDEKRLAKPVSDRLGHATVANDVTLTDLRRVIRDNPKDEKLRIYDLPTLLELEKMQWQAQGAGVQRAILMGAGGVSDKALKASAPPKMHDDLVIATALALKGLFVVGSYHDAKPQYPLGTMGAIDGHADGILQKEAREREAHGPFSRFFKGR